MDRQPWQQIHDRASSWLPYSNREGGNNGNNDEKVQVGDISNCLLFHKVEKLSDVFKYELSPVPSPLIDGDTRKGNRVVFSQRKHAVLFHKLTVFSKDSLDTVGRCKVS